MPIAHPRHVRPQRSISATQLLHALSLHRPRHHTLRHLRFVHTYMKKQGLVHSKTHISAHIRALQIDKCMARLFISNHTSAAFHSRPVLAPTVSISARRLGRDIPSLQNNFSSSVYRFVLPVLSVKTPLPNLIPASKFPSPFTPINQVLHTPLQPPEPHKLTPPKQRSTRNWQWSPMLVPRLTSSPGLDDTPSPDSPICDLIRRLSHFPPPSGRRLSYSQACASPWTPNSPHGQQALASPVLIRSTLWTPTSPAASPRYQLDDLQFSPFHVCI